MGKSFKQKTFLQYIALCGVFAVAFYVLHDVYGRTFYPGYDWMSQAVSDLTASDAPSRVVAGGLSNVYGTLSVLSSMALVALVKDKWNKLFRVGVYLFASMNLVSNIGYALFPLSTSGYAGTVSDIFHLYVVTISVVLLSIISMILIAIGGWRSERRLHALSFSAVTALVFMISGAMLSNIVSQSYFGLVERLSTYSAVIFTGIIGVFGFCVIDDPQKTPH
ncbi:MAG: DUF998 domain-containing protein [Bacilli bacterium]|nr:DUF998 domain-containing protein [Bacilli bacterium]MBN2697060.1 DUF998 domain-containing protein [Bacilli bacterium]